MRSNDTKGVLLKTSAERPSGPPRPESGSPRARFVFVFCPRPSNAHAGCRSSHSADTRNRPGTMPIRETDQTPFLGCTRQTEDSPAQSTGAGPQRLGRPCNLSTLLLSGPGPGRIDRRAVHVQVDGLSYPMGGTDTLRLGDPSVSRQVPSRRRLGEPSCRAFGGPFRHACSTLRSLARHGRPKRPRPFR